ncbi:MAG: hypothetical protein KDE20_12165 [Caldilineaceae bacterium]|nr:hypothetical protein [Caldilineaceae bacterium]
MKLKNLLGSLLFLLTCLGGGFASAADTCGSLGCNGNNGGCKQSPVPQGCLDLACCTNLRQEERQIDFVSMQFKDNFETEPFHDLISPLPSKGTDRVFVAN